MYPVLLRGFLKVNLLKTVNSDLKLEQQGHMLRSRSAHSGLVTDCDFT